MVERQKLKLTFCISAVLTDALALALAPNTALLLLFPHNPRTSRAIPVRNPITRVLGVDIVAVLSLPVPELHSHDSGSRDQ